VIIGQAGAVLANVLSTYGLVPTGPLHFDPETGAVAEKMAQEVE